MWRWGEKGQQLFVINKNSIHSFVVCDTKCKFFKLCCDKHDDDDDDYDERNTRKLDESIC
jgi:hypothetical protein